MVCFKIRLLAIRQPVDFSRVGIIYRIFVVMIMTEEPISEIGLLTNLLHIIS